MTIENDEIMTMAKDEIKKGEKEKKMHQCNMH